MAIGARSQLVAVEHARFLWVESGIFTDRIVVDCFSHACSRHPGGSTHLDICCQYGADVDGNEKAAIEHHRQSIAAQMTPGAVAAPWFEGTLEPDADFPSGLRARTAVFDGACIFLDRANRGCAIHRAAIAGGWDLHGVKPMICRLWPLTWDYNSLGLADDYADYSCAFEPQAPTVYQGGRSALSQLFGAGLVDALDAVEAKMLGASPNRPRRLPIVGTTPS